MAKAFASALEGRPSMAPSIAGPLSATMPVPERSPLAGMVFSPSKPPASKLDPNAPTAPELAMTEPMPAREPPARASFPAPNVSNPPVPTISNPPVPTTSKPPAPLEASTSPLGLAFIVLAGLVLAALAVALFFWVLS
jgi:hypothetical protein